MINAIITDFDGTLVDTFEANFRAYQEAFRKNDIILTSDKYRECFGYRFDRFMEAMGVKNDDICNSIKELKKDLYPKYFAHLVPNTKLIKIIATLHDMGVKTAIASTARKENLKNAINHLGLACHFDLIYAGVDVVHGKPSPDIYNKAMRTLGVMPEEVLIFEDSSVGLQAAEASGAKFIHVTQDWFNN